MKQKSGSFIQTDTQTLLMYKDTASKTSLKRLQKKLGVVLRHCKNLLEYLLESSRVYLTLLRECTLNM